MIIAELISFEKLIPFAMFGGVAAAIWWALEHFAARGTRASERLDELTNPTLRRRKQDEAVATKKPGTVSKMLAMASPALAKPLQPKSEQEQSKLKTRLSNAGFRAEGSSTVFLGMKVACLLVGLMASGVTLLTLSSYDQKSLLTAVVAAGVMFYLPDIVLWFLVSKRKEAIFLGLPDALDLMVVCVEAGLGLDQAMRKVSEEMKFSCKIIAEEFNLSNFQLQMGRSRSEVLHELGVRTGVNDVRSLASILIQADKFGSSIAQALRVQSDSMRTRRKQLAEEKAAKTAVKLLFPLVLFIFPGIFVVLVGPAAITVVRDMMPMMQGS